MAMVNITTVIAFMGIVLRLGFPCVAAQGVFDARADSPVVFERGDYALVRLEIIETRLTHEIANVLPVEHPSGIDRKDFRPGTYESTGRVTEVLEGNIRYDGGTIAISYGTFDRYGAQYYGWAVNPPLEVGEVVILPLYYMSALEQAKWGHGWLYLTPHQPVMARPGAMNHDEALETLSAVGEVLDAEGDEQWRLLREYALGDDPKLAAWAADILVEEVEATRGDAAPDNHRRAAEMLAEIAANPGDLTEYARSQIAGRLWQFDATRATWLKLIEALATAVYDDAEESRRALGRVGAAASVALNAPKLEALRKRLLDIYAAALANRSILREERMQHLRRLSDDERGLRGSDYDDRFHVMIEVLGRSDEAEIEIAVAATLGNVVDDLTPEHVDRIGTVLPQVDTEAARSAIREVIENR